MDDALPTHSADLSATAKTGSRAVYALIFCLGVAMWWLSRYHPALLPFWAPWQFSPGIYLATALAVFWWSRGLRLLSAAERPPVWRRVFFLVGVAAIYAVLQTRYDYWAQHMFFLHRIQHVVMHHLGPFLVVLGGAGAALHRGMPRWLQRVTDSPGVTRPVAFVQQPWLAAFLFVGLIYFWLIPAIHFRAMLDVRLYGLMNWTMVVDGILFWWLVLDARPRPPARISYGMRAALAVAVMFPQIALGAFIAFAGRDLYPFYDLCGRLFPSMGALGDQHIGGIVIWIPPAMMSVVAVLLVLNTVRLQEQAVVPRAGGAGSASRHTAPPVAEPG